MKIAIVDDSKYARKDILNEVEKCMGEKCDAIDLFEDGVDFLAKDEEYQIVFMDIQMPKSNGLQVGKEYKEKYPESILILATFYDDYCSEGYKVNAFRYIYKGKLDEEIPEALEKAMIILHTYEKFSFHVINEGKVQIRFKDIIYIETDSRKRVIHTTQGTYMTEETLESLTGALEQEGFYRVHKSYLVNMDWVRNVDNYKIGRGAYNLRLKNGITIFLSRAKKEAFSEALTEWRFRIFC